MHAASTDNILDDPSVPPVPDASPGSADGAPETENNLFSCPNCDYQADSVLAIRQHVVVSHSAALQGDGKPLPDILTEQSDFVAFRKMRSNVAVEHVYQEVHQKVVSGQTAECQSNLVEELLMFASDASRDNAAEMQKTLSTCPGCYFKGDSDIVRRHHRVVHCQAAWIADREPLQDVIMEQPSDKLCMHQFDKISLHSMSENECQKSGLKPTAECSLQSQDDLPSTSSVCDTSADDAIEAAETEKNLFACPNCDYKVDSILDIRQHCVRSHNAVWQDDGKPLRRISAEQSYFARLHKKRFGSHERIRKEAQLKSSRISLLVSTPASACTSTAEGSDQPLQESSANMPKSTEATLSDVSTIQDSKRQNTHDASCEKSVSGPNADCISPCRDELPQSSLPSVSDSSAVNDSGTLEMGTEVYECPDIHNKDLVSRSTSTACPNSAGTAVVASSSGGIDTGSTSGRLAENEMLACPNCYYVTAKLAAIRLHCVQCHILVWQGKGLPLRAPLEGELSLLNEMRESQLASSPQKDAIQPDHMLVQKPVVVDETITCPICKYVTINAVDIQLHCIRRHSLEWQGKGLPLRMSCNIPDERAIKAPLEGGELSPLNDLGPNQLTSSVQRNIALQQSPCRLDTDSLSQTNKMSSETNVPHKEDEKSVELEQHGFRRNVHSEASTSVHASSTSTSIATEDGEARGITTTDPSFLASIMLPPSTNRSVSFALKKPGVRRNIRPEASTSVQRSSTATSITVDVCNAGGTDPALLSSIMLPPSTSTEHSVIRQSSAITLSSSVTTTAVSTTTKAPELSSMSTESESCDVIDMEIDNESATDIVSPQIMTLSAAGISSISNIIGSKALVPLHGYQIQSGPVASDYSMDTPPLPCPPSFVPPTAVFASPPVNQVPPAPTSIATLQREVPVTQPDEHSLLLPGRVIPPHHRGMMPPPVREQLNPYPGLQPRQFPRAPPALSIDACHSSASFLPPPPTRLHTQYPRPEMTVNSTSLQAQGQLPGRLPAPSSFVCNELRPIMATNSVPVQPPGVLPGRLPVPSPIVCRERCPVIAANPMPVQPSGEFSGGSPSRDIDYRYLAFHNTAAMNSAPIRPPEMLPARPPVPSDVVCDQPHPEMAINPSPVQQPGEFCGRSPPHDVDYRYLLFHRDAVQGDVDSATDRSSLQPTSAPTSVNAENVSSV